MGNSETFEKSRELRIFTEERARDRCIPSSSKAQDA
jgi:hypothetical protein